MSLRIFKTLALLFVITLSAGCGQKGDLYLPGEKQVALVADINAG